MIVLVVVVMLSLAVYSFSRFMFAQWRGSQQMLRQRQARLLAESGVEYLRVLLSKEPYVISELGELYDNENEFKGHIVTNGRVAMTGSAAGTQSDMSEMLDLRDVGRFSVIASRMNEEGVLTGEDIRYGLEDESAKINLRWLLAVDIESPGTGRTILMRLPGVTETLADSILDWLDEDAEPREFGAEDEDYAMMDPPYYARNALPDSLDELLLVQEMTPKLLYGIDWNRNGLVDLGEPDETTLEEFDVNDGSLNLGLVSYLTLDSREANISSDGLAKINVNMEDVSELRTLLEERFEDPEWVEAILSVRESASQQAQNGQNGQNAPQGDTEQGDIGQSGTPAESMASTENGKINSILDFVQSANSTENGNASTLSPFSNDIEEMREYLPVLYDNLTTSDEPLVGRININQAPRAVLEMFLAQDDALTGMAVDYASQMDSVSAMADAMGFGTASSLGDFSVTEVIEGILAVRETDPYLIEDEDLRYPFWPYTQGIIEDFETMKQLEPYFCTQGGVFKATVVGRFDERSPVIRLEVWLDATALGKPARVIRVRDLSELGPGYASDLLDTENER